MKGQNIPNLLIVYENDRNLFDTAYGGGGFGGC